jgi:hypothetical protein
MNFLMLVEGIMVLLKFLNVQTIVSMGPFDFLNMQTIMSIEPFFEGVDTPCPSKGKFADIRLPFDGRCVSTPTRRGPIDIILCIFKKLNSKKIPSMRTRKFIFWRKRGLAF